jgi:hypothetical protein
MQSRTSMINDTLIIMSVRPLLPHLIGIISRTPPGAILIVSFDESILCHPGICQTSPCPSGLVCFSYPTLQTCLDIDVGQTTERRNVIMKDWYLERVLAYGHMYLLTPLYFTIYKNTIINLLDTRSTYLPTLPSDIERTRIGTRTGWATLPITLPALQLCVR